MLIEIKPANQHLNVKHCTPYIAEYSSPARIVARSCPRFLRVTHNCMRMWETGNECPTSNISRGVEGARQSLDNPDSATSFPPGLRMLETFQIGGTSTQYLVQCGIRMLNTACTSPVERNQAAEPSVRWKACASSPFAHVLLTYAQREYQIGHPKRAIPTTHLHTATEAVLLSSATGCDDRSLRQASSRQAIEVLGELRERKA